MKLTFIFYSLTFLKIKRLLCILNYPIDNMISWSQLPYYLNKIINRKLYHYLKYLCFIYILCILGCISGYVLFLSTM